MENTYHEDMYAGTVENRVYNLRHAVGETQETLAEALGVSRQTVIAIEKGNYVPSVLLALKIAQHFRKPVEEIFLMHHGR